MQRVIFGLDRFGRRQTLVVSLLEVVSLERQDAGTDLDIVAALVGVERFDGCNLSVELGLRLQAHDFCG